MGDFQGHPFRGNQWTDGRTMGISSPARSVSRIQRSINALRQQRSEVLTNTKTKQEWQDEYLAAHGRAQSWAAAQRAAEARISELTGQMRRDLAREFAAKREANDACGEAWRRWNGLVRVGLNPGKRSPDMPEIGSDAMNALSPDLRAAAIAYRESQKESVAADDRYYKAEEQWAKTHAAELDAARTTRNEADRNRAKAAEEADIAHRAVQNYDRDLARSAQTGAEAREPRNTAATQYYAMDAESQATLDRLHEDGGARLMRMRDGTYVDVRAGQTPIVIRPGFKATVRDGKEFKARMEAMFPGVNVEGLPRKADPHILTLVHDEFQALRDEFPEVAVRTVKMNAGGMRGVAYPVADKITLGRDGVESFTAAHVGFARGKRRTDPAENPSFHDGQRNYAGLVRHEFAHQLHFQYPEILKSFDDEVSKLPFNVRTKITEYARKDNMERFAETFTMMKYGDEGTKKHPAVKIMADVIAKFLANKRRKP